MRECKPYNHTQKELHLYFLRCCSFFLLFFYYSVASSDAFSSRSLSVTLSLFLQLVSPFAFFPTTNMAAADGLVKNRSSVIFPFSSRETFSLRLLMDSKTVPSFTSEMWLPLQTMKPSFVCRPVACTDPTSVIFLSKYSNGSSSGFGSGSSCSFSCLS